MTYNYIRENEDQFKNVFTLRRWETNVTLGEVKLAIVGADESQRIVLSFRPEMARNIWIAVAANCAVIKRDKMEDEFDIDGEYDEVKEQLFMESHGKSVMPTKNSLASTYTVELVPPNIVVIVTGTDGTPTVLELSIKDATTIWQAVGRAGDWAINNVVSSTSQQLGDGVIEGDWEEE